MRLLSQETLTEELMNCYNNAGYTVGILCSSLRMANDMASQFRDMLGRIDGAERIERNADPVTCMANFRMVFWNGSALKILTPSSRERDAGERFDRILYEEDTTYHERLEYMALGDGLARYDDVIGTVEANREETSVLYDDFTYTYAERPSWERQQYYNTTTANSAWCTTSQDYYWMPSTTTTTGTSWVYTPQATSYYEQDKRRRNIKYKKLVDSLREKPKEEDDDIDNEAFDSFMKKLESGEELK